MMDFLMGQVRELDLMLNPQSMQRFRQRVVNLFGVLEIILIKETLEVETPILQSVASGSCKQLLCYSL